MLLQLPDPVLLSVGGMALLKLLGFHFQAKEAMMNHPYIIFPHNGDDELILPTYEALSALQGTLKLCK